MCWHPRCNATRLHARRKVPLTHYDPARYGEAVGDYDALYPGVEADTEAAVQLLSDLARARPDRSVLELGIGTGRLALKLHRKGLRVAGIDGSERMIAQLRTKPGGDAIEVALGDYRDTCVNGAFSVVVLALNGIFDPRGRQAQLDIFRNAARHLAPGGCFVVESWVINDAQRSGEWTVIPRFVGDEHVEFQLARYDIAKNTIDRTLVHLRPQGMDFVTVTDTYASPGELDVMAHVTGFERIQRYSGWTRGDFTSASANHVSIYERRDAARG
jgi:SAM-dependent methyltransferase